MKRLYYGVATATKPGTTVINCTTAFASSPEEALGFAMKAAKEKAPKDAVWVYDGDMYVVADDVIRQAYAALTPPPTSSEPKEK